jgi:hypothetical protein
VRGLHWAWNLLAIDFNQQRQGSLLNQFLVPHWIGSDYQPLVAIDDRYWPKGCINIVRLLA